MHRIALLSRAPLSILPLAILVASTPGTSAGDEPKYIRNKEQVPAYNQHDDFTEFYRNRPTDLMNDDNPPVPLTYRDLRFSDYNVRFAPRDGPVFRRFGQGQAPANTRSLTAADQFNEADPPTGHNFAGGGWHCGPTAAATLFAWGRQNALRDLPNFTRRQAVDFLAEQSDCNDQNAMKNSGDGLGHLGVTKTDLTDAENAYIRQVERYNKPDGPKAMSFDFSKAGYMRLIDRQAPPIVLYKYKNTSFGHAVMGIGYHIADATDTSVQSMITRDPWDGREGSILFRGVTDVSSGGATPPVGGTVYYGGEPPAGPFPGALGNSQDFEDAKLNFIAIPDYGDAPSSYDPITAPAAHRCNVAEHLGARVTSEVGKLEALDDEDGQANVGDNDGGDDGVTFHFNLQGQLTAFDVVASTIAFGGGPRYVAGDQTKQLWLGAWADLNNDGQWTFDEQLVGQFLDDGTLAAWNDGEQAHLFSFGLTTPIQLQNEDQLWLRFRLAYGEAVGPTGLSEFGEVEDYVVPSPGSMVPLSLLGLGLLRRRR
jgi:hypothetical protein